jgi:MFS family permease
MAEGAPKEAHGRAFGMERAGDAAGAVMGPLLAMLLLARGMEPRHLMLVSLLPGFLAFLSIAWLVAERTHVPRRDSFSLSAELAGTGLPFRRYLALRGRAVDGEPHRRTTKGRLATRRARLSRTDALRRIA